MTTESVKAWYRATYPDVYEKYGTRSGDGDGSPKSSGSSAKAEWESLVQSKVAQGLDMIPAMRAVEKEHPGLRQSMIDSANAGRTPSSLENPWSDDSRDARILRHENEQLRKQLEQNAQASRPEEPRPVTTDRPALHKWNGLIRAKVMNGKSPSLAASEVAREHPTLRQEMIEEFNQLKRRAILK